MSLLRPLTEGSRLQVGEQTVVCKTSLELGHKIAARDIASGEKIIKYGAPIGSGHAATSGQVSMSTCTTSRATTYPPTS